MKDEWNQTIAEMQAAGYAVIVWTPDELGDVSADFVEERSIDFAHEYLLHEYTEE